MPYFVYTPSNQLALQRLAGAELRAMIIKNFKDASRQRKEIEIKIEQLKLFLEDKISTLE